jgi:FkbM family methyltransferase
MMIILWVNKMAEKLSKSKLSFIIFFYRYIKIFLTRKSNVFTKYDSKIINNIEKTSFIIPMLEDEISKKIYQEYIKKRINRKINYADLKEKQENEYIIEELKLGEEAETIVDAGAYTGGRIVLFKNILNEKINKIFAFEADVNTFEMLKKTVEINKLSQLVVLFNFALFRESTLVNFKTTSGPTSFITMNGNSLIKAVKLDDIINEKVTFIKMDIEGGEMDALIGAEEILKRYKPKLAISLYHNAVHLWEIPIFLKTTVPEYKFYIRHHSDFFDSLILYAVV